MLDELHTSSHYVFLCNLSTRLRCAQTDHEEGCGNRGGDLHATKVTCLQCLSHVGGKPWFPRVRGLCTDIKGCEDATETDRRGYTSNKQ